MYVASLHFVFTLFGVSCRDNFTLCSSTLRRFERKKIKKTAQIWISKLLDPCLRFEVGARIWTKRETCGDCKTLAAWAKKTWILPRIKKAIPTSSEQKVVAATGLKKSRWGGLDYLAHRHHASWHQQASLHCCGWDSGQLIMGHTNSRIFNNKFPGITSQTL